MRVGRVHISATDTRKFVAACAAMRDFARVVAEVADELGCRAPTHAARLHRAANELLSALDAES